ncbi:GntR family transcriptional regulator [Dactylosporangium sp. NPDC049742]|uniref:GntR family transcriptional regulator n=1 Tax=Dactylosporangium sp. NPDC049742 TaxID=3154737 RepID=UPI00341B9D7E
MIDRSSDRPLYQQLADLLREQIRAGELAPGAFVPSESSLMQEYELGRPAVRNAVAVLRQEGLVVSARGARTMVRPALQREVVELRAGDEVIGRMPTDPERRDLGIDPGEPILEVTRSGGEKLILPAGANLLRAAP